MKQVIGLSNLDNDFTVDVIKGKIYVKNILSGSVAPTNPPTVTEKIWFWVNTSLNKITHYWNGSVWILITIGNIRSRGNVTTTGVLPNVDIVTIGAGATAMTATIPTSSMTVGQVITIKRNTGATGTLTLQGQSGSIQALNNTLGATTTLAAVGAYGQCVDFMWDGTNLLRVS